MMANANKSMNGISNFKGSAGKLILAIVAVLALAGFYFNFSSGQSAEDAELKAIRAGDVQAAYNLTTKAFKQRTPLGVFTAFLGRYPGVRQYTSISFTDKYVDTKTPTAAMAGMLVGSDGRKIQVQVQLAKEGKVWRVQGLGFKTGVNDAIIRTVLVGDGVDANGDVTTAKTTIDKLSAKIYVTAQVYVPKANDQIEATLTELSNRQKFGHTVNNITQTGNVLKSFVFTKTTNAWAVGEYEVMMKLSSGDTRLIKFMVK
jgi:hypothetical protein